MDDPWVVRDAEGRVLPDGEAEAYMERSRDHWMQIAREARDQLQAGVDINFHCYQIGVRVGLAREANHTLLEVRRHRMATGYQAALF